MMLTPTSRHSRFSSLASTPSFRRFPPPFLVHPSPHRAIADPSFQIFRRYNSSFFPSFFPYNVFLFICVCLWSTMTLFASHFPGILPCFLRDVQPIVCPPPFTIPKPPHPTLLPSHDLHTIKLLPPLSFPDPPDAFPSPECRSLVFYCHVLKSCPPYSESLCYISPERGCFFRAEFHLFPPHHPILPHTPFRSHSTFLYQKLPFPSQRFRPR